MTIFSEYTKYDAIGLAELVRNKEITPAELCEEAIRRIEKLNPKINAVIHPMYDLARKAINHIPVEGVLAGVPFLLKDQISEYAGVPMTCGSKALKNYIPDSDSEIVKRYKKAGLVILGKTNCSEFGLLAKTEPDLHGPTRNPWNLDHSSGGSSGGSGAAVSAGMVPMASGSDGGGSIRIPASSCGLFGLKPTRGRTPTGPNDGEIWQGMVVKHVITRSVRDSAATLDILQGADIGAPYIITPPELPYLNEIKYPPRKLRIAFNTKSPVNTPVHPECEKAVYETAKLLLQLGHDVEEDCPEIDGMKMAKCYFTLYFGEVAAEIKHIESMTGKKLKPSELEPLTWTLGLLGRTISAGDFVFAKRYWNDIARAMGRFHQKYDLYMTPTVACPPPKIGEIKPKSFEISLMKTLNSLGCGRLLKWSGMTDRMAVKGFVKFPFTEIANFTGQPAMSVPLHWTVNQLPIGVQFIAPFGDEATLFRFASQLEKAKPWFDKMPSIAER
ncbi:MAG: amidase [Deltaproteobacteria bacterium]